MDLNINFYKNAYLDLKNMSNDQLIIHWKEIGIQENRLNNPNKFFESYNINNINEFEKNNKNLKYNDNEKIARIWHGKNYDFIINKNNIKNNEKKKLDEKKELEIKKINLKFYKKAYLDLKNMSDKEILNHWKEKGITENRLLSPIDFLLFPFPSNDLIFLYLTYF